MVKITHRDIFIEYPEYNAALDIVQRFLEGPRRVRPEILVILGLSGMGKTAICDALEQRQTELVPRGSYDDDAPIIRVEAPVGSNQGTFLCSVIDKLLMGAKVNGMPHTLIVQASNLIKSLGTRVLIIDNAHRIEDPEFSQMLLALSNDTRVHLVLAGLPGLGRRLKAEEQLDNRLDFKIILRPWMRDDRSQKFILNYLDALELLPGGEISETVINRIVEMGGGRLGRIKGILHRCRERPDLFPSGVTEVGLAKLDYRAPGLSEDDIAKAEF